MKPLTLIALAAIAIGSACGPDDRTALARLQVDMANERSEARFRERMRISKQRRMDEIRSQAARCRRIAADARRAIARGDLDMAKSLGDRHRRCADQIGQ